MAYGETDEIGLKASPTRCTGDFHATVLHLLGMDHEAPTFYHNGIEPPDQCARQGPPPDPELSWFGKLGVGSNPNQVPPLCEHAAPEHQYEPTHQRAQVEGSGMLGTASRTGVSPISSYCS